MNITNEKVTSYINGLYRSLNGELRRMRSRAEALHIPIIQRDTETFLLNLIRIKRPSSILEIGTAVGYSAACMALACDSCRITTIEADPRLFSEAKGNIGRMGLSGRIEVLLGSGQELLNHIKGSYDLVFIDAAKSHYRTFWDKALPLCKPGAVVVCDNVLMQAMTVSNEYDLKNKHITSIRKMREFLTYITQTDCADTSVLPIGDGISLSVLKG